MYDWKHVYSSLKWLKQDIPNFKVTHCGWYIEDTEFDLISTINKDGKEIFEGKIKEGDSVILYHFSGRIQDSAFGITIPTVADSRTI